MPAWHDGQVMTIDMPSFRRPSYMRRAPRWYDGVARLLDLGGVFDLRLPPERDADKIIEDRVMIAQDMRIAVERLREGVDALDT